LIKEHKNADPEGNFPTRLVVTARNFTLAFPKTSRLGIKRIPDDNKVAHRSKTTIQASDLRENLENQGITCNNSMMVSADAEDSCTSARLKPARKVVQRRSNGHVDLLIKLGMQSTLLIFVGKCDECDGDRDPEEKVRAHHWWF